MTVMEQLSEAQDRVLQDVKTAQARVVEANERFIETAGQWLPKVELPRADAVPAVELPKREELVASYFDFASRMLEANRTFVEQLFGVWNAQVKPAKATRARTKAA
jgi:hypothetical protein